MKKSLFYMVNRYKIVKRAVKKPIFTAMIVFLIYSVFGISWIYLIDWYFGIEPNNITESNHYFSMMIYFLLFNGVLVFAATFLGFNLLKSAFERIDAEIDQKNKALRDVEKEFSDLTRKMSHDLRAPIRSVQGFSEALHDDYLDSLDQNAIDYLNRIRKSAERMNSLIVDLVEYVKISTMGVSFDAIDVVDFIDKYVKNLVNKELPKPLKIESKGAIPVVYADKNLLQKVLYEVLLNAGLYIHKDTAPIITITGREHEFYCEIGISDNGIGIDPIHQESIFTIFTRLHGVESYPGLGIGLAIAKRCMHRMAGEVTIKSDGTSGSRIILRFQKHY